MELTESLDFIRNIYDKILPSYQMELTEPLDFIKNFLVFNKENYCVPAVLLLLIILQKINESFWNLIKL